VALERLTYDRAAKAVTYRSDKSERPTAGTETADPLEFLARVLVHIPDKGQVTTRYCGWYANRPRGMRRQAAPAAADGPPAIVPAPRLAPTEASRRWAALLQQVFEVDPLACPACQGAMRIVAFITQSSVIDQILAHLRTRAARESHTEPRSPPSTRAPVSRGASRAAPVRRHHDLRVRTAPHRRPATKGTFGVRGGPTAAAPRSPPASAGPGSLARTAGRPAREARRRGGGRADARSPALARQGTGAYTPPHLD
jgi:hypothetical protein